MEPNFATMTPEEFTAWERPRSDAALLNNQARACVERPARLADEVDSTLVRLQVRLMLAMTADNPRNWFWETLAERFPLLAAAHQLVSRELHRRGTVGNTFDSSEPQFQLDSTPEPPPAWKPEDRRTSPRSLPGIAPDFKTPSIRGQKTFLVD